MKIYFGNPTGKRRDKIISEYGCKFGACLTRDYMNSVTASTMHYFFDNSAFSDFRNNREFDADKYLKSLLKLEANTRFRNYPLPDFVVIPDTLFGTGNDSLRYSLEWLEYLEYRFPWFTYYLVIQSGMSYGSVKRAVEQNESIKGLFLGGDKEFKYATGEQWVKLSKELNVPIHVGGIGTYKNTMWAKMTGFDSCDSSIAMIHTSNLNKMLTIDQNMFWNVA